MGFYSPPDSDQIRSYGANKGSQYYGEKMVGDSHGPKRCTDSCGFSHLTRGITFNAALSKPFWNDDRFKDKVFDTGTAAGMVSCMERAWSIIPDRLFIADCNGYLRYLFTVVDAEGSFVVDSETRSGRRYQALRSLRSEAEGDERATKFLKRKPRPRQRTATQVSMKFHPDLAEMVEILEADRDESKQEGAAAAAVGGT